MELKKPDFEKNLEKLVGYTPNKWQREVREVDSRFKVICAGRRSGKSLYVVRDSKDGLVSDLLLPNQHIWIVAPNYDLTQRVWNDFYNIAISKFKPIIQRIHNSKGNYRVETALGTVIEAKSAEEEEKLVGVGLTKIIVDEAALVKQKAWTQSLRPTLIDHEGKGIFISTPKGKNWFWELWMRGQSKDGIGDEMWRSWRFTSFENEYLKKSEIDDTVKDMPEFEYRQEILAEFEETAEQVFRHYKECAIGRFAEPKAKHRYQIGVDIGRKHSYSAITVIDEMTYPYEVVYHDRFRKVDWDLQKLRIKKAWDKYPCLRLRLDATSTGGDVMLNDLEHSGIRVDPFVFTENSKKELINKAAIFIEDGRIIYPNIKELLDELETYGREITKSGRIKYGPMGKKLDDCVDSLALAIWGLPHQPRRIIRRTSRAYNPVSEITGY